ncbi:MAG: DUF5320 family protein [Actinomycetota bacterium]|nr:DUF5320 family protein [Actinomycetota bacterium]
MGYGHRNMYYLTGQPGWMRLGYSPGWAGRSRSGLGPCAEYILTGRWPAPAAPFAPPTAQAGFAGELELLKAQAERMEQTLAQIRERIDKLEKEEA